MPRTYPFDHFTVPQHDTPAQPEGAKARISGQRGARGDGRPHYGKRFAGTEELSQVHQMNHQLEELAGMTDPKLSAPREPERPQPRAAPAARGFPIGAVPPAPPAPEPETVRDLIGEGAQELRLLRHSVVDGLAASYRLATLPLRAAMMTARWMRSLGRMEPHPA